MFEHRCPLPEPSKSPSRFLTCTLCCTTYQIFNGQWVAMDGQPWTLTCFYCGPVEVPGRVSPMGRAPHAWYATEHVTSQAHQDALRYVEWMEHHLSLPV